MAHPAGSPRPVTPSTILAALIIEIDEQLSAMDGLDPGLRSLVGQATLLAAGLDPYLSRCTTPESPALRALAERTRAFDWRREAGDDGPVLEPEMLSGHVEGQVLKFLVGLTGARRVLEIGMFTGYSALAMAEALPDDGVLVACELDAEVAAFARRSFEQSPSGQRIVVKVGPAKDSLDELAAAGEVFDLVFVDADKGGYLDYVRTLLDAGLLAPDGLICVDNTLMQGQPYLPGPSTPNGDAIAAFNQAMADDPGVEQVLLPLRDGLTLIRRATAPG